MSTVAVVVVPYYLFQMYKPYGRIGFAVDVVVPYYLFQMYKVYSKGP